MKISKKVANRIKAYSAMGTALLGTEATAAIVYTDVSPDFNGGTTSTYMLDLNNDAVNDFTIKGYSLYGYGVLYALPSSGNAMLGSVTTTSSGGSIGYPYVLNNGSSIGASAAGSWASGSVDIFTVASFAGNWVGGVTDKYVGLKIAVGGNTYYGWCRISVSADGTSWVIKDYAYEDTPNTPILAGNTGTSIISADVASNINAADIGNTLDGTDLQFSFDKASDETTVSAYRVMAVKSSNAAGFDLNAAQAVAATNYVSVTPNGSATYTQSFPATGVDVDGDPIANNQPYKIFVLSVADGTNASADALSASSAEITLINDIGLDELDYSNIQLYGYDRTIIVDLQNFTSQNGELTIANIAGQIVYRKTLQFGSHYNISLEGYTAGIYVAIFQSGSSKVTYKMIIE